jgi:hypothetical protein
VSLNKIIIIIVLVSGLYFENKMKMADNFTYLGY